MGTLLAGERIKKRRKDLGLTQQQLAKTVGVSHVSVSQWERGETEPSGDNLLSLATALRCDPGYLLYGAVQEKPPQLINQPSTPCLDTEEEEFEREKRMLLDMFSSLPSKDRKKFLKEISDRKNEIDIIVQEVLDMRNKKDQPKAS